jgi:Sensors of blue-light using FAD
MSAHQHDSQGLEPAPSHDFEVDQILYCSLLREPMTEAAIEALAQSAARLNRMDRITGLLMHSDGVFVQLIEGPAPAVAHLWSRLLHDKRHYGIVQLLHRREVEQRTCGDWDMRHVQFEVLRDLIHSAKEDISKGKANAWAGAIERMDFLLSQDNWRSFVKDLQSSA